MAFTAFLTVIFNFILNYILIEIMGVYGLALATSLVAILNSFILFMYIKYLQKSMNFEIPE